MSQPTRQAPPATTDRAAASGPGHRVTRWRARILAALGMAAVLAAGSTAAYARTTGAGAMQPSPRPRAAATQQPALSQDLSSTLPWNQYGQTTGDFLGEGHYQVAYFKDGKLDINEANKFGGALKESVPTDLKTTPNDGLFQQDCSILSCFTEHVPVWQDDNYKNNGASFNLTGVKTASSASNIYMAGATWDDSKATDTYRLHLYKLRHDGSCARASCAVATVDLPHTFDNNRPRLVVVTSLAVGVVGGKTLIAVGLSDFGIYIYDDNLNLVAHISDMGAERCDPFCGAAQTPVTSLGFGPPTGPGQGGVLAAGVESPGSVLFSYRLNPDGTEKSMSKAGNWGGVFLAAMVANVHGQQVTVFGRSDGYAVTRNPDTGDEINHFDGTGQAVSGLTALTPWDGSPDNQELVVQKWNGTQGGDQVLKYLDGELKPVPIGTGGATSVTDNQLENWWPGYGLGVLRVANSTAGPVQVSMAARPDPGFGCWLDASLKQPPVPAFPADPTPVGAGQTSHDYLIAALTAGPGGDCASAEGKGEWASYLVLTPVDDPADQHMIKLRVTASRKVEVDSQAGGDLTATVTRESVPGGLWGLWTLTITGPAAPKAAAAPTVTGYRLTSAPKDGWQPPPKPVANDPRRPVYRFDVTGAKWTGIGVSQGQVAAQIPAMTAQGSTDGGKTWRDLGRLMPTTAPVLDRGTGTVTLGAASFFWQDPPDATPLTDIRVGSGGLFSGVIHLADLKAPPLNSTHQVQVLDVEAKPATGSGTASPLADGLDQATLNVTLTGEQNGLIASDDPRYGLVYYRDKETDALITGLYAPGEYSQYLAVGPFEGAYSDPGTSGRVHNYLATTSTAQQPLVAEMNDTGTSDAFASHPVTVIARATTGLGTTGTAAKGVQVTGCVPASICPLATPTGTSPVLYQAGSTAAGPVTGLQLRVEAVTGVASLPLEVGTANAHTLASAPLEIPDPPGNQAVLRETSGFWPAGTIDTALVSSGELVRALSVTVGGS